MSDRRLASIRRISDIRPIEGADNIVCAVVDGWEVVTQKSNNFQIGDLAIYFEVDSVLPEREEFEFLRDRCYVSEKNSVNGAGFRLKTIRLRKQVSQGLILPLDSLYKQLMGLNDYYEGMDLTDILDVVKYEKPLSANLSGVARGNFPSFVRKTDQERIQNIFSRFKNKWINHRWEVTTKLDGSSFTAYINDGVFGVCSRNLDLEETEGNAFWQAARLYDLESKMKSLDKNIAIQGELIGEGIQKNQEKLTGVHMYVFDIWDIKTQTYYSAYDRYNLVNLLGLSHTPVTHLEYTFDSNVTIEEIKAMADGPSLNPKVNREGLVFKSLNDPSISWKIISDKWLLKNE